MNKKYPECSFGTPICQRVPITLKDDNNKDIVWWVSSEIAEKIYALKGGHDVHISTTLEGTYRIDII